MKFVYEFQEILKLFLTNSRNSIKPFGEFSRTYALFDNINNIEFTSGFGLWIGTDRLFCHLN